MTGNAYKFDATVGPAEAAEAETQLPAADAFADLVVAAGSTTGFLDNPLDDEEWNRGGVN